MTRRMAAAGADVVLVITPFYYKNGMTDEALYNHFSKVHCNLFSDLTNFDNHISRSYIVYVTIIYIINYAKACTGSVYTLILVCLIN